MDKQGEIIKILEQEKILSAEQLSEIMSELEKNGKRLEEMLLEKNIITAENFFKIKAKVYKLPYENLLEKKISEGVLNTISSEVAQNYKIICFDKTSQKIKVGITDPENFKAMEAVDFLAKEEKLQVEYYLISKDSLGAALKQYQSLDKELNTALENRAESESEDLAADLKKKKEEEDVSDISKSAPITKIVSVIIRHAVEGGASDIHIEPMLGETRVRYRIDGILHTSLILPKSVHNALVARIKVMAKLKLDETRIPQGGRIRLAVNEKETDFRVSILPLVGSEKVVMRILETSKKAPSLESLGFDGVQMKVIKKNLKKTEGILLSTGPTGSGKSTTLFSLLTLLNKEGVNIATLEDPVEYQIKGVNQSQIKPDIGYTFASGLRSFLRQDPDIIMVGEIRDEETAELAIHAALTGHYVLSTLHTNNALGSITRLVDMKVQPFLLGSTLHTVIAQRLARKICPHCKEKVDLPQENIDDIEKEIDNITVDYIKEIIKDFDRKQLVFYKGKGCPRCGNTGYFGRVALSEVLDITEELKDLIIKGVKNLDNETVAKTQKYITVKQDGVIKVLQGLTTLEEVYRVNKD
ncbi:MAG: ATPase, T2SS/T4P/T4SS family [Patescibacteria group bacterium]|nr:ATPase, T2SS/T4P/T4SS family [Patescibacteria group bacterium]